jgi:chromatin remodeling complex protein RSC6
MAAKGGTTASGGTKKTVGGSKTDGLHRPVQPSAELGAIIGDKPMTRSDVVSKIWDYIKKNDLQNPKDKREILADAKLEKIFGKKQASMFEMNKHISAHLKPAS